MRARRARRTVLKHNRVRMVGRRRLPSIGAEGAGSTAMAEIVSQENGKVVIKVTCSCGEEIQLECAYNDMPGAGLASDPKANPQAQNA